MKPSRRFPHSAVFRYYGPLNDFLAPQNRHRAFTYRFDGGPAIKDPIEAMGVPHTEVEAILANGDFCGFERTLQPGDRVAVYPPFLGLDVPGEATLRPPPPAPIAFVADVHLGTLVRNLRLLGFDTRYRNDFADREIVDIGVAEGRVILTRDRRLLFHGRIEHGCFIRSDEAMAQTRQVLARYRLHAMARPFSRCLNCNGRVEPVAKSEICQYLAPRTARFYDEFFRCRACRQLYWRGSHHAHLQRTVADLLEFPAQ